jgi:hypothetical protein
MKEALRRKLHSLWLRGIAIGVILVLIYCGLRALFGAEFWGDFSLLALIILAVILLEGSAYWWLKLRHLDNATQSLDSRFVQATYIVNLVLLVLYPAAILIATLNETIDDMLTDVGIGSIIYLLALIVFVHYFLVKLVRSDADRSALTRRRQVNARFMRELQRNEARRQIG